jgi:hypothetical protein
MRRFRTLVLALIAVAGVTQVAGHAVAVGTAEAEAATVTVSLDAVPDSETHFLFGFTGPTMLNYCACFVLQDDGDAADGPNNLPQHTFQIAPGTYRLSFRRADTAGWVPMSESCSDGSSPDSISISAEENITCSLSYTRSTGT